MNKRQKEVINAQLNDEKKVLENLENVYTSALAQIKKNVKQLQTDPLSQSKAYQIDYQKQLEKQINGILDQLQSGKFTTLASYMETCYTQGFVGTMYDIHGQGVPVIVPINENQVVKAVQKTSDDVKLVNKLGVNTNELKQQVLQEVQRGFATEMSYSDIARNISLRGQADLNRSMLIARTEGHRIQNEAKLDALSGAKDKGADVVKQWDSTLDDATRETHRLLDGQIREIDEDFEVEGATAPCPGGFGDPSEDCNCRCAMLERARWALDEDELQTLEDKASFFGLDKTESFDEFKEKYLQISDNSDIINNDDSNPFGFKTISGNHSRNDDLAATNPNYSTNKPEWTRNCQRCVSTYEARIRGYDVTAKPRILNGTDKLPLMKDRQNGWTSVYKNPKLQCLAAPTRDECKKLVEHTMSQYGDDTRAIVRVKWTSGGGHVFFAEQKAGKTLFVDPQTGNDDCSQYFDAINSNETYLLRVDNLDFTDKIRECCQ